MAKRDFVVSFKLLDKQFKKGIGGLRNSMQKLRGFAITALSGLGIANFGRSMIEAGKNFESGMARVKAVTNATQQQMKMMSDEAERLGATTKYSASQAAGALENLTRNGLTAEQATKALSKTLQLAQANSIELAEAADLATNVMNGFGLSVDQLGRVNDNLSSTASHSATNVLELGEAVKNVAPLANNCGIKIEEVCAALGTLANVGIKGADAGTALKQVLIGLSSETPKGVKAMAQYGLNINQATIAADGLEGTLKKLAESGIGKDNQALADVFGRRAFAGAAAVINNYEKFISLNKTLQQSSGETERMFGQAAGKMDAAIKGLQSAWEALMISIFRNGEGGMVGPINAMSDAIRGVRNNIDTVIKVVKGAAVFAVIAKGVATLKTLWSSYTAGILMNVERTAAARANAEKLQTSLEAQQAAIREKIAEAEGMQKRALMVQLNATAKQMQANRTLMEKAAAAERTAIERAAAMQTAGVWGKVTIALKGVGMALKAAFSTTIITAAITVVMELASKLYGVVKRSNEIKNIWSDYKKEAESVTHTREIAELKQLQEEYNGAAKGSEYRKRLEKQIVDKIGDTQIAAGKYKTIEEQINAKIKKRIELLEAAAKTEFYTKKKVEQEDKKRQLLEKYDDNKKHYKVFTNREGKVVSKREENAQEREQRLLNTAREKAADKQVTTRKQVQGDYLGSYEYKNVTETRRGDETAKLDLKEITQLDRTINDATKQVKENTKAVVMGESPVGGGGSGDAGGSGGDGGTGGTGKGGKKGKGGKEKPIFRENAETIKEMEENVEALEDKLKNLKPNTEEYKATTAELKKWKDTLDAVQNSIPEGSMASNDKKISALEEQMSLTVDPASLYAIQTQLDKFKKANETLQLRIDYNAADISGAFKKGAQLTPELKFPTSDEISAKMQGVTEAINASWLKAKEKQQAQQGAMMEATQQFASGMSSLGSAFEIPELNAAGVIAQAVANIIMSFSTAAMQASSLGPWGWIAFSLAGIAQVASMVAAIKNMGTFANGGTIGGHSYSGDKLLARVNSGERILPAKKAEELDDALANGAGMGGQVDFIIRADKLYGVLKNYTDVAGKTKKVTKFQ